MREIAERLILDLVAFAVAAAQQMGSVLATLVGAPRGDDMNCSASLCHARITAVICGICQSFLVTTNCTRQNCTYSVNRPTTCALGSQMKGELQTNSKRVMLRLLRAAHRSTSYASIRHPSWRVWASTGRGPRPVAISPIAKAAGRRVSQG